MTAPAAVPTDIQLKLEEILTNLIGKDRIRKPDHLLLKSLGFSLTQQAVKSARDYINSLLHPPSPQATENEGVGHKSLEDQAESIELTDDIDHSITINTPGLTIEDIIKKDYTKPDRNRILQDLRYCVACIGSKWFIKQIYRNGKGVEQPYIKIYNKKEELRAELENYRPFPGRGQFLYPV
jgi:hypothetical protein